MKGIKTCLILYQLLIAFLEASTSSLSSQLAPDAWLSEYGYIRETPEELNQVSFPVNQHEFFFNNSFLSQTETEVVVQGNLSFIMLTCEAEYPISWVANQVSLQNVIPQMRVNF